MDISGQILVLQNHRSECSWRSHPWDCVFHEKREEEFGGRCGEVVWGRALKPDLQRVVQRGRSPVLGEPEWDMRLWATWVGLWAGGDSGLPGVPSRCPHFLYEPAWEELGSITLRGRAVPWKYDDGTRAHTVVLNSQGSWLQMARIYCSQFDPHRGCPGQSVWNLFSDRSNTHLRAFSVISFTELSF